MGEGDSCWCVGWNNKIKIQQKWKQTKNGIQYVKNTSEAIRRILPPLGIRTTFCLTNKLCQLLVHPKDPVPKEERSGVIYCIPCTNCLWTYIGQTGRTLVQRIKEHQITVHNCDLANSALAEHSHSTERSIKWDEAYISNTCSHTSRQCLLESWAIHKESNPLNRELGTLPHIYKTLIRHS